MHYQRWRRTGDPLKTRRAGRPTDVVLESLRMQFSNDWSPRTITRYKFVLRIVLTYCTESRLDEELGDLIDSTRFANGKWNVAGLEREALARLRAAEDRSLNL